MSLLKWIEKNPFEAAALGTAAYFTGGAALGAMGGAGGAAGMGAGATGLTLGTAPTVAGMGGTGLIAGAGEGLALTGGAPAVAGMGGSGVTASALGTPASGLLGSLPSFKEAASYASPVMQSMQAASIANGLLGGGQQKQTQAVAPQGANPQGAQTLAQLYQQGIQPSPEDQARLQRKTMWG